MSTVHDSYEPPEVATATGYSSTWASASTTNTHQFSYGDGANESTLSIMMIAVFCGYALLLTVLMMMCICRKPRHGFIQFDPEDAHGQSPPKTSVVSELDAVWRKAFMSKVYGILVIQLFVTVVMSYCMMQFGGAKLMLWTMTDGSWAYTLSFLGTFVSLIALMCFRDRFPHNLILLFVFTLIMSWSIGMTCTMYAARGKSAVVVEAFAITSIIFVALTLFTIQSKIDFSFLGMGLSVALLCLIVWGMFATFAFPSFAFSQVYALAGSVIFSLYVVYDTYLITQRLAYDEYIMGAISLYLDFINLFLFILRLLAGGSSND
mmetsp:Transcript_35879/g.87175  ORF Transcript_35879/g.87175 Transcript_35879/m.87175 type:complete len:320 (-) Transcript_35879:348-1307(-)|eukprot:CAMPEP_0182825096 /NCGR_PEP_ID=MMETSP0006_2-20121128/15649_1 /TAXON_ID=97485 /ORGANISM="Prymnesium parvum, Strain Texoma1" /LENGTH=319 /DNA_ID=CAMNT_0024952153 /DNA_START=106 /DNA_END=1065 /DNA_ORIENTATION=+